VVRWLRAPGYLRMNLHGIARAYRAPSLGPRRTRWLVRCALWFRIEAPYTVGEARWAAGLGPAPF
jgi:hypothetical protein